jgi:hypothetical protein
VNKIISGDIDPNTREELKVGDFDDLKMDEIVEGG